MPYATWRQWPEAIDRTFREGTVVPAHLLALDDSASTRYRPRFDQPATLLDELIDEALGRVLKHIEGKGWGDDLDVIYTADHGEFQGDFGMLFKGPYLSLGLPFRTAPEDATLPFERITPGLSSPPGSKICLIRAMRA